MARNTALLTIRVDPATRKQLAALAKANDRTSAAEARRAIRELLQREGTA